MTTPDSPPPIAEQRAKRAKDLRELADEMAVCVADKCDAILRSEQLVGIDLALRIAAEVLDPDGDRAFEIGLAAMNEYVKDSGLEATARAALCALIDSVEARKDG